MDDSVLIVDSYFDGEKYWSTGPYTIALRSNRVQGITSFTDDDLQSDTKCYRYPFCMPSLTEAHCHLFLDGDLLDPQARSAQLASSLEEKIQTGRYNLSKQLAAGVTLVNDAGDAYGVNLALKQETNADGRPPLVRCAGRGIHRKGHYGSFIAHEIKDINTDSKFHNHLRHADFIKVILTDLIDLATGTVKGPPQFDLKQLSEIVRLVKTQDRLVQVHCSGMDGLKTAIAAGVFSIEHGFFLNRELLDRMADKQIVWVPTFSPLVVQAKQPQVFGHDQRTVASINRILEQHLENLRYAFSCGVPVLLGSDAGSCGVAHGRSLLDELILFLSNGLPPEKVLNSATVLPLELWQRQDCRLAKGKMINLVAFGGSPFESAKHLLDIKAVFFRDQAYHFSEISNVD